MLAVARSRIPSHPVTKRPDGRSSFNCVFISRAIGPNFWPRRAEIRSIPRACIDESAGPTPWPVASPIKKKTLSAASSLFAMVPSRIPKTSKASPPHSSAGVLNAAMSNAGWAGKNLGKQLSWISFATDISCCNFTLSRWS